MSHDGGYRSTTVDTEPRRWSIMSHDGGYQATMVEYHEPTTGGYQATMVGIMSHNGGYRSTTVEYHEPRRWIPPMEARSGQNNLFRFLYIEIILLIV